MRCMRFQRNSSYVLRPACARSPRQGSTHTSTSRGSLHNAHEIGFESVQTRQSVSTGPALTWAPLPRQVRAAPEHNTGTSCNIDALCHLSADVHRWHALSGHHTRSSLEDEAIELSMVSCMRSAAEPCKISLGLLHGRSVAGQSWLQHVRSGSARRCGRERISR